MSKLLRRLHGRRTPPGLEIAILRRMPLVCLAGTAGLLGLSVLARVWPAGDPGIDAAKLIASVDIFVFAIVVTFWTAALTVSIACFIIFIMKGPAYVADPYPLCEGPEPPRFDAP